MIIIILLSISIPAQAYTEQKVLAIDGDPYDYFGHSVSISDDVAIIGSKGDDDNGNLSGSAYVFRFDGSNWVQEQILLPNYSASCDHFGHAVSVDGDVIVIGDPSDNNNGANSGSAYVFRWDGTSWIEEEKLLASDGDPYDNFGNSVSVNGDVAIVGAHYNDKNSISNIGSAYVFRWDGTSWIEEAKLLASDGDVDDYFGFAVSVDADTAVIGSPYNDDNGIYSGSAYVFQWDGTSWIEEAKLLASDAQIGDRFGYAVSVDGNVIAIGADLSDDNGSYTGSAYVFQWDGTNWIEEDKLLASDGNGDDLFGCSVSVSGNTAVIGSYWNEGNDSFNGAAYFYDDLINSCDPNVASGIIVDSFNGTSVGPGGPDCPFKTIAQGINETVSTGIDKVIVRGGFYPETVTLLPFVELEGELRWDWLPPLLISQSIYQSLLVNGADDASLKYFILYEGGMLLDGTNRMVIEENAIVSNTKYSTTLTLTSGASDNTVSNNLFYHETQLRPDNIRLESNSDDNEFINNTIHTYQISPSWPSEVIGIYLANNTDDNIILNNIFQSDVLSSTNSNGVFTTGSNVTTTVDYNLLPYSNPGIALGVGNEFNATGFADFIDPLPIGIDYSLDPSSQAVDAGNPDPSYDDFDDGSINDMGITGGPNSFDFLP